MTSLRVVLPRALASDYCELEPGASKVAESVAEVDDFRDLPASDWNRRFYSTRLIS